MGAGRPPDGLQHINRLEGPRELKKRLRWIYASMMNQCTVEQACEALGIRPARLHQLRNRVLQSGLEGLAPGKPGRPKQPKPDEELTSKVKSLERQVNELKLELYTADLRRDLAAMERPASQKKLWERK